MSSYERNTGMKVFSKLYVGYKKQDKGQVDLGFATPYEDNAAGRRRQETVNSWALGWHNKKPEREATIIDNDLAEGFKITDDIKRVYYGGGNVVFRVEDPRGFELEIQAQNLMTLIRLVGTNKGGEIPGRCCWGRDGGSNILIHETSEEYKTARLKAEEIKPLQGIKADFKRGDIVILTNGQKAKYLGRFWFTGYEGIRDAQDSDAERFDHLEKVHFFSNNFILGAPKVPSDPMYGERLIAPKQFYAVQFEDDKERVHIYREMKAVAIDKPVDKEMTTETALKYINSRYIRPASAADMTHYISAADHKRGMVWTKEAMTEQELEKLKKRILEMNKRDFYGIYDYVSSASAHKCPVSFVIEDNGDLWHTTHGTVHDSYKETIIRKNEFYAELIRLDNKCIYHNCPDVRSANHYYHVHRNIVTGTQNELFIFSNHQGTKLLDPLDSWFKEGKLFMIKPVYEEEA